MSNEPLKQETGKCCEHTHEQGKEEQEARLLDVALTPNHKFRLKGFECVT